MVQVNANEAVKAFLTSLKVRSQILDERGLTIGIFEPSPSDEEERYRKAATLFDPEDIQRSQMAEGPCSTTDEVLNRMRSMGDA